MSVTIKPFQEYNIVESLDGGYVLAQSSVDNELYRMPLSFFMGNAVNAQWKPAPKEYNIPEVVEYNNKWWKTLIDNNVGIPPVETSSSWVEVSKAGAQNLSNYVAGVYDLSPSMVIKSDKAYVLSENVTLPFDSTDFDAELIAGTWKTIGGNDFDSILLHAQTQLQQPHLKGRIYYDEDENLFRAYNDLSEVALDIGEETWARVYNDNAFTLGNGKVGSIRAAQGKLLLCDYTDATDLDSSIRCFGVFTQDILPGEEGYIVRFGIIRDIDTTGCTVGDVLYADPTEAGKIGIARAVAPNFPIRIGICAVVDSEHGAIGVDTVVFNGSDTSVNTEGILDGMVTQTPNVAFSVSGGIIYADITNEEFPLLNLPFLIGGVRYILNTTTSGGIGGAARVIVPPGNDPSVGDGGQKSWIYITLNASVPELAVGTTKPSVINAGICTEVVFDAATTLSRGKPQAYRRENNASSSATEGIEGSYGFMRVLADDARSRGSAWDSGQDPTSTVNDTTIQLALTAGVGKQLHYSSLPLFDGLLYQIYNDITNAITYVGETNLVNIVTDANGGTLLGNGFFYALKFYYKLNSNGLGNDIIVTRPKGHYSTGLLAESDALDYTTDFADTKIEDLVYPLYEMIIERSGTGGGLGLTVNLFSIKSLRSKTPGAGGGSGGEGVATDDKIRISAADTTNDYLNPKISVGSNLIKNIENAGVNEVLNISLSDTVVVNTAATTESLHLRQQNQPQNDGTYLINGRQGVVGASTLPVETTTDDDFDTSSTALNDASYVDLGVSITPTTNILNGHIDFVCACSNISTVETCVISFQIWVNGGLYGSIFEKTLAPEEIDIFIFTKAITTPLISGQAVTMVAKCDVDAVAFVRGDSPQATRLYVNDVPVDGGWTEDLTAWGGAETTLTLTSDVFRDLGTVGVSTTVTVTLTAVTSPRLAQYHFKFKYSTGGSFIYTGVTPAPDNPTLDDGVFYEGSIARGVLIYKEVV